MADNTHIEWTDATWNPVTGCSVISPGCTNCYAMKLAGGRLRHHPTRAGLTQASKAGPVWTGEVRFNPDVLGQPLRWTRPRRIFVCAHSDLFHEDVPDAWVDQAFAIMALAPQHTFQVLTKRAERMAAYMQHRAGKLARFMIDEYLIKAPDEPAKGRARNVAWPVKSIGDIDYPDDVTMAAWPLPNVWLGVSAEDQPRADDRIPRLLATPAAKRFVSLEPLLGGIQLHKLEVQGGRLIAYQSALTGAVAALYGDPFTGHMKFTGPRRPILDSVIVGGENGPRPMHPDWVRQIRDDCAAAGVPFLFKQWGSWAPDPDLDRPFRSSPPHEAEPGTLGALQSSTGQHAVAWQRIDPATGHAEGTQLAKLGKRAAGRLLDGVEHNGGPW